MVTERPQSNETMFLSRAAQASPQLGSRAEGAGVAGGVAGVASLAAVDVAGASNTSVAEGLLLAGQAAGLVIEGEGGTLVGSVDVAGAADAAEEASGGWLDVGGDGGGGSRGDGWAEGVASAAAAVAHVGGGGRGGLGDDEVASHFGGSWVGGGDL